MSLDFHFRKDVRICVATRVLQDTLQHNKVIAMTILYSTLTKGGYSEKKKNSLNLAYLIFKE